MQRESLDFDGIGIPPTIGAVGLDSRCDQQRSLRRGGTFHNGGTVNHNKSPFGVNALIAQAAQR